MQAPHNKKPSPPIQDQIEAPFSPEASIIEAVGLGSRESNPMVQPTMIISLCTSANPLTQEDQVHIEIDESPSTVRKILRKKGKDSNHVHQQKPKKNNSNTNPNIDPKQKAKASTAVKEYPLRQSTTLRRTSRLERKLTKEERKERTFFFGIFNRKHGLTINLLRLVIVTLLSPFLIIALVYRAIISTMKLFCCEAENGQVKCCYISIFGKETINAFWDVAQFNCQSSTMNCQKKYKAFLLLRDQGIDSCISCFTKLGECFGYVMERLCNYRWWCYCYYRSQQGGEDWGESGCTGCENCVGSFCGDCVKDCDECCLGCWGGCCDDQFCEIRSGMCECCGVCSCFDSCDVQL